MYDRLLDALKMAAHEMMDSQGLSVGLRLPEIEAIIKQWKIDEGLGNSDWFDEWLNKGEDD